MEYNLNSQRAPFLNYYRLNFAKKLDPNILITINANKIQSNNNNNNNANIDTNLNTFYNNNFNKKEINQKKISNCSKSKDKYRTSKNSPYSTYRNLEPNQDEDILFFKKLRKLSIIKNSSNTHRQNSCHNNNNSIQAHKKNNGSTTSLIPKNKKLLINNSCLNYYILNKRINKNKNASMSTLEGAKKIKIKKDKNKSQNVSNLDLQKSGVNILNKKINSIINYNNIDISNTSGSTSHIDFNKFNKSGYLSKNNSKNIFELKNNKLCNKINNNNIANSNISNCAYFFNNKLLNHINNCANNKKIPKKENNNKMISPKKKPTSNFTKKVHNASITKYSNFKKSNNNEVNNEKNSFRAASSSNNNNMGVHKSKSNPHIDIFDLDESNDLKNHKNDPLRSKLIKSFAKFSYIKSPLLKNSKSKNKYENKPKKIRKNKLIENNDNNSNQKSKLHNSNNFIVNNNCNFSKINLDKNYTNINNNVCHTYREKIKDVKNIKKSNIPESSKNINNNININNSGLPINININYYNEINQPKKNKETNTTKTNVNISDIHKSIEPKKTKSKKKCHRKIKKNNYMSQDKLKKEININDSFDLNQNNLYENNKNNIYDDMLYILPNNDLSKINQEKIQLTTLGSVDNSFYINKMEKLSLYIKNYYIQNQGNYPPTGKDFYLYGREVGHGAFGKVNLSLHVASGKIVAIKIFNKKNLKRKNAKQKIKNEIEMLGKLRHPFICQILDSFKTDTHIFIVMEYICSDLLHFIKKRGKLSETVSKIIFKQLIEGLQYIHKKKIVHRDIKLDNILIDLTNTIKICDFGVSRKIDNNEIMHEHCGTPAYIAPEIFENLGYQGFQCDIWSAGVTLYYILGGKQPFRANSMKILEQLIIEGIYEKLNDVSEEANDLIAKMLETNPEKRININQILKHPWLNGVNTENRYKLNLFTDAEKILLSKYNVNYFEGSYEGMLENFTDRNLDTKVNSSKEDGNTKSLIYAPYNTYIEDDDVKFSNKKYYNQEKEIHSKLKIENNICKFGFRVQQANIDYELSNNQDFDNGVIKTQKEEDLKNENEKIQKIELINVGNEYKICKPKSANDSFEESEKILFKEDILEFMENKIGYKRKYVIECIKKNVINYATATYYLLAKNNGDKLNVNNIFN